MPLPRGNVGTPGKTTKVKIRSSVVNSPTNDSDTTGSPSLVEPLLIETKRRNSLRDDEKHASPRTSEGSSTIAKSSFNLIKNLAGAGVLTLPHGVATFANSPSAIIPASLWILFFGAIFAYSFQLIAKICRMTMSSTFREVWEDTMGRQGGLVVSFCNMVKPGISNLAYSMILADTFKSLFITFSGWQVSRTAALVLVTVVGLLPLCLLKNLNALAPFSILGTAGIFLTAICMGIRYFDGTYDETRSGRFLVDLDEELKPSFGDYNGAFTGDVLVFAAMAFEAYIAHYNAPRFMAELKDANMTRFRIVVGNAFGFSSLVYIVMTAFGFLTFGGNCDGYILNNYSTNDVLATACRVAIAFSILFTYPIAFMGFRDGLLNVIELPLEKQTATNIDILTVFLLTVVTIFAAVTRDLGFINVVGGGTLATAIVFVFPALMYHKAVDAQVHPPSRGQRQEVKFAFVLMVVGIIMGVVGVLVELRH